MGSNDSKPKTSAPPPVRPIEVKTYVMSCQAKMSLYRNKKVYEIKKKKDEIVAALKQNNLDIAKAKMESIIRLEDTITVYDILGPLCEILKERITYLMEAQEVPPDIKAQLDTIIYASSRVDIDDLYKLRDLVQRKYGSYYIQAADQNKDGLVNINVIEKLKIRPPVDAFLTIRLKQLCKEKKIKFEFPEEIAPSFDDGMGMNNNFNQQNPYAVGDGMLILLPVSHSDIFPLILYRLIGGTDDPVPVQELLDSVSAPPGNSGDCEDRREQLFRESQHLVHKTAVKVHVCADALIHLPLCADQHRRGLFHG